MSFAWTALTPPSIPAKAGAAMARTRKAGEATSVARMERWKGTNGLPERDRQRRNARPSIMELGLKQDVGVMLKTSAKELLSRRLQTFATQILLPPRTLGNKFARYK